MKPEKKEIVICSNSAKGENVFHAWNGTESFYVFTQRGKRGIDAAFSQLTKEFGKIYLSICHVAHKSKITRYFA